MRDPITAADVDMHQHGVGCHLASFRSDITRFIPWTVPWRGMHQFTRFALCAVLCCDRKPGGHVPKWVEDGRSSRLPVAFQRFTSRPTELKCNRPSTPQNREANNSFVLEWICSALGVSSTPTLFVKLSSYGLPEQEANTLALHLAF